jgi:hypothetical protein
VEETAPRFWFKGSFRSGFSLDRVVQHRDTRCDVWTFPVSDRPGHGAGGAVLNQPDGPKNALRVALSPCPATFADGAAIYQLASNS